MGLSARARWWRIVSGLIVLGASMSAVPAHAQDGTPEAEWYGWQTLIVDGVGLGLGLAVAATAERGATRAPTSLAWVGTTMYGVGALGAPAVHYAQGRYALGAADFALRVLMPPVTGLVGAAGVCLARDLNSGCADEGLAVGSLLGVVLAMGADAALLAWDRGYDDTSGDSWYGWESS
jgi:hypothetical protein